MSIFDFGVDFGLTFFKDSSKKKLTQKQYQATNVDYYSQTLEQSSGIYVPPSDDDDEDDEDKDQNKTPEIGNIGNFDSGSDTMAMSNVLGQSSFTNTSSSEDMKNTPYDLLNMPSLNVNGYNDALVQAGFSDKSNSFLGKNFGIYTATVPSSSKEVKKGLKGIASLESLGKSALKAVGMNSLITGAALGFAKGKGIPDPFGNNSFRPDHAVFGAAFDLNMSNQFRNVAESQAALRAYTSSGAGMSGKGRATGWNGYTGGQLVSRGPNKGYYDGVSDLSQEQLKRVEAIQRGFIPETYSLQTETGERGLGMDTQGGMYTERGTYVSLSGTAAAGSMKSAQALADKYGLDVSQVTTTLSNVRNNTNFFSGTMKDKTLGNLSQRLADLANRKGITKDNSWTQHAVPSITNKTFDRTDPTKNLTARDKLNKAQTDAATAKKVAEREAVTKKAYQDMLARQRATLRQREQDNNNNDDGSQSAGDQASVADEQGGMFTAKGGFISKGNNFAAGGVGEAEPAGFIGGRPEQFDKQTTIADDIPLKVKDGTFVINAPAVEYAGSIDVQKMLSEGYEKAMTRDIGVDKNFKIGKIPSRKELDIQISRGEVVVPPHVAKAIGYDRLEKINNRGKREVTRRQKAGDQEKVGFASHGGEQKFEQKFKEYEDVPDPYADYPFETETDEETEVHERGFDAFQDEQEEAFKDYVNKRALDSFTNDSNIGKSYTPFSKNQLGQEDFGIPRSKEGRQYRKGVEFGDIEAGFDLLSETNFNKLLLAGLRDTRSLSDFAQVVNDTKSKAMDKAYISGAFDPTTNNIIINNDSMSGATLAHELMHKGAFLLEKDPNYKFIIPKSLDPSGSMSPKDKAAQAEHRYIQAVVNQAFLNRILNEKAAFENSLIRVVKEGDSEAKKQVDEFVDNKNKSTLVDEINRVFNIYMTPENRKSFLDAVEEKMGYLDIVSPITDSKGKLSGYGFKDLAQLLTFEEIRIMFSMANEVMATDFATQLFLKEAEKSFERADRSLPEEFNDNYIVNKKINTDISDKINTGISDENDALVDEYFPKNGMKFGGKTTDIKKPKQGFMFRKPDLKTTGPNIDKYENSFIPGLSDEPVIMKPDEENFFGDYSLAEIKDAIFDKEMKGYKDRGFIFTGVRAKEGKGSSAFGTMQITYSTLEDFIDRSRGFKQFPPELQKYTKDVAQQGRDKVNIEINKGIYRDGKKITLDKIPKQTKIKLSRLQQGMIPQEIHKKYYDKLADAVIRQKLKDYKNKSITEFLESYGEGSDYAKDVYNILRDKIQIKN